MNELEEVKKIVSEFFDQLKWGLTVDISQNEALYKIDLTTEADPAIFIGHHASTLSALQRVLSVILYRQLGKKISILVDINNYREEQKERLEGIAKTTCERVKEEGRPATLREFSPFERRVIHEYVTASYPDLASRSEGEGRERTIIIEKRNQE